MVANNFYSQTPRPGDLVYHTEITIVDNFCIFTNTLCLMNSGSSLCCDECQHVSGSTTDDCLVSQLRDVGDGEAPGTQG